MDGTNGEHDLNAGDGDSLNSYTEKPRIHSIQSSFVDIYDTSYTFSKLC